MCWADGICCCTCSSTALEHSRSWHEGMEAVLHGWCDLQHFTPFKRAGELQGGHTSAVPSPLSFPFPSAALGVRLLQTLLALQGDRDYFKSSEEESWQAGPGPGPGGSLRFPSVYFQGLGRVSGIPSHSQGKHPLPIPIPVEEGIWELAGRRRLLLQRGVKQNLHSKHYSAAPLPAVQPWSTGLSLTIL